MPLSDKEFRQIWDQKMAEAKAADNAASFAKQFNTQNAGDGVERLGAHGLTEDQTFEMAVEGWENYDALVGPGGAFANAPITKKLELEFATFKDYGPRPELKTAAEIAEEISDDRHPADRRAEWADLMVELAKHNVETLAESGYASMDDLRAGNKAQVPSLVETADGVPAYLLPNGEVVEQYAVAFGKAALNPRFSQIDANVKRIRR
jgi:hypothetical protein